MGIMSKINLDLLCRLLQEVHRACYVKLSGATVIWLIQSVYHFTISADLHDMHFLKNCHWSMTLG